MLTVAAVLTSTLPAATSIASDAAAEALVHRFLDGYAREAEAERRAARKAAKPARRQKLPSRTPPQAAAPAAPDSQAAKPEQPAPAASESPPRHNAEWQQKLNTLSERLRQARKTFKPASRQGFDFTPSRHTARPPAPSRGIAGQRIEPSDAHPRHARNHKPSLRESSHRQARTRQQKPTIPALGQYNARKVTILLLMRNRLPSISGIRQSLDPVVCIMGQCFVSAGPTRKAAMMPRMSALGPVNSLGRRAGACRRSPTCTFRDVELSAAKATLQPIDLGWVRHDRRLPVDIKVDDTCKVIKQHLSCRGAFEAVDFRVWIVPEDIALQAGPAALQRALRDGLRPLQQHASSSPATLSTTVK